MHYFAWFYGGFEIDFKTILMTEYRNKPSDGHV